MCCFVLFSVAANFIRCRTLKVGSREMLITEFTGNVRDFPPVNKEEQLNDERGQCEHRSDRSNQPSDEQRCEGACHL